MQTTVTLEDAKSNGVVIVGSAYEASRAYQYLSSIGVPINEINDIDSRKWGLTIGDHTVLPQITPESFRERRWRNPVVIVCSNRPWISIKHYRRLGLQNVVGWPQFQIENSSTIPVHPFFAQWEDSCASMRTSIESGEIYELFCDEGSHASFIDLIAFRQSHDFAFLKNVAKTNIPYFSEEFVPLPQSLSPGSNRGRNRTANYLFIDGGSYDGDSIVACQLLPLKPNEIIAVEPDPINFNRLQQRMGDQSNIHLVRRCLAETANETLFIETKGRASTAQRGINQAPSPTDNKCLTITVDTLCKHYGGIKYIKLNIEGFELEALRGARATLAEHKSTFAIAAYHKSTDILDIPRFFAAEFPEYKLSLRIEDASYVESVIYATPG